MIRKFISFVENNDRIIVISIVIIVILTGILYSIHLGDQLRFPDANEYFTIANHFITKNIYTFNGKDPTAYRLPGYTLLLAFLTYLGATITHIRILNFVALGFSIYLLYLIVKNQSSRFAAVVAAVLVICYPVLFYLAGIIVPQTISNFLFLYVLYILFKEDPISMRTSLIIGSIFGFLVLMSSYFTLALFLVVFWVLIFKHERKIINASTILFTAVLIISIWSVRNYIVLKTFIPFSTQYGIMFLAANSENTTPNAGADVNLKKYFSEVPKDLTEVERDNWYKDKAFEYILNNKSKTLKMYFLKALNYFNYHNKLKGGKEGNITKKYKDLVMLITYGPLLFLFILRILSFKRFQFLKFEILFIVLYFSHAFAFAIYMTRIRYRLTFDFLLIAVVAVYLFQILTEFSEKTVQTK